MICGGARKRKLSAKAADGGLPRDGRKAPYQQQQASADDGFGAPERVKMPGRGGQPLPSAACARRDHEGRPSTAAPLRPKREPAEEEEEEAEEEVGQAG